jgi:hypothetical protein
LNAVLTSSLELPRGTCRRFSRGFDVLYITCTKKIAQSISIDEM